MRLDLTTIDVDTLTSDQRLGGARFDIKQIPEDVWNSVLNTLQEYKDDESSFDPSYNLVVLAGHICMLDRARLPAFFADQSFQRAQMYYLEHETDLLRLLKRAWALRIIYNIDIYSTSQFMMGYPFAVNQMTQREVESLTMSSRVQWAATLKLIAPTFPLLAYSQVGDWTFEKVNEEFIENLLDTRVFLPQVETLVQCSLLWPEVLTTETYNSFRDNADSKFAEFCATILTNTAPLEIIQFASLLNIICSDEWDLVSMELKHSTLVADNALSPILNF